MIQKMKNKFTIDYIKKAFPINNWEFAKGYNRAILHSDYQKIDENKRAKFKTWDNITKNNLAINYYFIFFLENKEQKYYFPTYIYWIANDEDCANEYHTILFQALLNFDLSLFEITELNIIKEFLFYCLNDERYYFASEKIIRNGQQINLIMNLDLDNRQVEYNEEMLSEICVRFELICNLKESIFFSEPW